MKLAICLYGNLGHHLDPSLRKEKTLVDESRNANKDFNNSLNNLNRLFVKNYDVDIFIHSWSESQKDKILEAYKPKSHIIEEQIVFERTLEEYGIVGDDIKEWDISQAAKIGYELLLPSRKSVSAIKEEMSKEIFRTHSRWYSTQQSIKLKKEYEEENGFVYDFVLATRFDNVFYKFPKLEQMPTDKFYASPRTGRPDIELAFFDYWFMSNSQNMNKFGDLYNNITDYCIRPTFSCREHVNKVIGNENVLMWGEHHQDYSLER
jgi:hypothetical protein|tara:strand:- start:2456 stop:3244 length:789 start_codon:yes stop_codon:yes gene_type:complete